MVMKTIVFLFDKETYKDGLDKNSKFNIFRWTYDMCDQEFMLNDNKVIRLDLSEADDLFAIENDFNDGTLNSNNYIMRSFIVDNNE